MTKRLSHTVRRTGAIALLVCAALSGMPSAAVGQVPAQRPEPLDVEVEKVTTATQDPTVVEAAPDGRLIWTERKGTVKVLTKAGEVISAGRVAVAANSCADCTDILDEGGLHGLLLAPDFTDSGEIYLYYSVPKSKGVAPVPAKHANAGGKQADEGLFRLSRFVLSDSNVLDVASEQILFENPAEWGQCCHYGGDMEWLPDGTMVLSVGDDTNPHASNGFAPRDARPDRDAWNAERTSANPADRRGKMLRLDVRDVDGDGSLVPADNPHVNDASYDPYVYASGFRSNYRFEVDEASGALIVGNVGPDARAADANRGPEGFNEVEVVPAGGGTDHGWPRCIAANKAYKDYNWATATSGAELSCDGMTPASFSYPYNPTLDYPLINLGSGRSAIAGPVYRYKGSGSLALPPRFQNKLIFLEYSRDLAYTVPVGQAGAVDGKQMMPVASRIEGPIDATVGTDGAVYIASYGSGFYNNSNSSIMRLKCAGCTAAGSAPAQQSPASIAAGLPLAPAGVGTSLLPQGAVLGLVGLVAGMLRRRKVI